MRDGADYNGNQRQQALTDDDIKRLHQDTEQYLTAEKTYDELLADLQSLMVPNEQPSAVSRGFDIEVNQTNIVNILGGKLTDYRLMASEATKKVAQILSEQFQHSVELIDSTKYQISGGHFNPDQVENHLREYETLLLDEGVTRIEAKMMANLYGSNVPNVMTYLKNQQPAEGLTRGQTAMLHYAIHEEMVTRPIDFVWRRTNYLLFHSDVLSRIESALINEMARVLSWTQSTKQAMIEEYQAARDISALKHLKERENING
jgi:glycerol-3-phosphate dehydrogenase